MKQKDQVQLSSRSLHIFSSRNPHPYWRVKWPQRNVRSRSSIVPLITKRGSKQHPDSTWGLTLSPHAKQKKILDLLPLSVSHLTISGTFHTFFKVLFNFRSHYFCTIGLMVIFSFRWSLPPISYCNPKQYYSYSNEEKRLKDGPLAGSTWSVIAFKLIKEICITGF